MKFLRLSPEHEVYPVYSHAWILDFNDLITKGAVLNGTFQLLPRTGVSFGDTSGLLNNRIVVVRAGFELVTPFTGGAIATCVVDIGDPGSVGRYIANANTDLFTALATNTKSNVLGSAGYAYVGFDGITNTILQAKITTTVGNLNAATAGKVILFAKVFDQLPLTLLK